MGQPAGPGSAQGCSKNKESDVIRIAEGVWVHTSKCVCYALLIWSVRMHIDYYMYTCMHIQSH